MKYFLFILLVCFIRDCLSSGFHAFANDGLSYCGSRPYSERCCSTREDNCTAPIRVRSPESPNEFITHLCYCDYFCDRDLNRDGNDCCPDFKQVCQQENFYQPMLNGNEEFGSGEEEFNFETSTNQGKNYTQFWGRTLEDGIRYRLGTLFPEKSVENMNEIFIKQRELPRQFDARKKWARELSAASAFDDFDQGDCGSSWAFSSTRIATDRIAILAGANHTRSIPPLSAQQLLDCNQHKQRGCQGGSLDRAWWYIRKYGLVSTKCYPYESGRTGTAPGICHIPKQTLSTLTAAPKCPNPNARNRVYKMTPPYRISTREEDIQTEILTNGPVQATFLVYEDFFMYSGGIYKRLQNVNEMSAKGYHSVKILGWGEEAGTKYWICQNWWGREWGETDGTFRILRGENHCEIESFVIGAWAKLEDGIPEAKLRRLKLKRRRIRRLRRRKHLIRRKFI